MRARLLRIAGRGLAHPRLPYVLALVAVALALPALGVGLQLDDRLQRAVLLGRTEISPWEMFSDHPRGHPELLRRYVDAGVHPWWIADDFRLAFLRIVAAATHRLDYALWPDSPALMHAHSLVWLGLLVAAATVLYRRFLGAGRVAGLAAIAYAVDDAHGIPAAWLANRYALVATFFGFLCLLAHDRWRRDGWRPGAWLGPLALGLALGAGEVATSTLAYLAGHALFLDPARGRRRLLALAPYAAVTALWASVYALGGFGVAGSAMYVDPTAEPLRFVATVARRAPFLLLGQWTGVPADAEHVVAPLFPPWMGLVAVGFVVVLVAVLLPLVRRDAVARFFATGMGLAIVPISGTFAVNRELVFVGFGAMGLFAQLVEGAFAGARWMPPSRGWRYALRGWVALLVPVHFVMAPAGLPLQIEVLKSFGLPIELALASVPTDPALDEQDLVVTSSPDYVFFVGPILSEHSLAGQPAPRHVRALANGLSPIDVTRLDERSLDVRLERSLFAGVLGPFYRDPASHPPGRTIELTGLAITILETDGDGAPVRVRYRFDRPLEDPTLRWLRWEDGIYVPFAPPAVGATVHLEPAIGPFERLGGWH